MRFPGNDELEHGLKGVQQNAVQHPGMETMVDFGLVELLRSIARNYHQKEHQYPK
jgi:hypothetical protein